MANTDWAELTRAGDRLAAFVREQNRKPLPTFHGRTLTHREYHESYNDPVCGVGCEWQRRRNEAAS
jgi:hypothetical protein